MSASDLEQTLAFQIRAIGLPEPVAEHRFHDTRAWRFDFAWPDLKIAAECEGGIFTRGRHVRPAGFEADTEKYNEAAALGWIVFRYTARQITSGWAVNQLEEAVLAAVARFKAATGVSLAT